MNKENKEKLVKWMKQKSVLIPVAIGKEAILSKHIDLPQGRKPYGGKK